jgi:hypothetical protein
VGSSPVSYSGGLGFKSHFRDQLPWFKFFIVFFSLCWQMLGYYPKLTRDHSLHTLFNLLFTNHTIIWHNIIWATDSTVK